MIYASGKLVEIETNEKGYRTAHLLNGRWVHSFDVQQTINGELDERMNQDIVVELRMSERWFETNVGRRPSRTLRIVRVLDAAPVHAHAA